MYILIKDPIKVNNVTHLSKSSLTFYILVRTNILKRFDYER